VCGSAIECLICHGYSNQYHFSSSFVSGKLKFSVEFPNSSSTTPWSIQTFLLAITMIHWRNIHFYAIHRLMHPWKISWLPKKLDIGHFLYKYVHSLHHKSYNPTAVSGTSMHPVEATLYYSAALMPFFNVALGTSSFLSANWIHPAIPLCVLVDCGLAAWLGHAGFDFPGTGDIYHQMHHACFDCNYGGSLVPFDYIFGTFASCKQDLKVIWRRKISNISDRNDIGFDGNATPVHESSSAKDHIE